MRILLLIGMFCTLAGCSYVSNSHDSLEPVQIESDTKESVEPKSLPVNEYFDASVIAFSSN